MGAGIGTTDSFGIADCPGTASGQACALKMAQELQELAARLVMEALKNQRQPHAMT